MEADYTSTHWRQAPLTPDHLTEVYLAFQDAFEDYELPYPLSLNQFHYKFVIRLGLNFELSAGVWDGNVLAAFILTTLDVYEKRKTAYHGCIGVRKKYRGNHLIHALYKEQQRKFASLQIKQSVLEVLNTNQRARHVYESLGFSVHRSLLSFQKTVRKKAHGGNKYSSGLTIPWETIDGWGETFPSFTNTRGVIARSGGTEMTLLHKTDSQTTGIIVFDVYNGRVSLLMVHPAFRRRGIGSQLLNSAITCLSAAYVACMNIPETDTATISFLQNAGFTPICEQLEMRQNF